MSDLITLDCYKDYKNINNPTTDGKIQSLITRVSALIENYCNRNFMDYVTTDKTEWFDAKTNIVYLKEFPVISVTSVNVSEDGGLNQTLLTEDDSSMGGYYVDLDKGAVMTQNMAFKFLDYYVTPYRSLEIAYRAGYTEDNLPEDLKLAVLDLVAYYLDAESKPTKTMLGATLDNPLPYVANSFPAHIRRILDLYRDSP